MNMKKFVWRKCRKTFLEAIFLIRENFFQSFHTKFSSSFYVITLALKISYFLSANHNPELRCLFIPEGMGVYKIEEEILEGWGVILVVKKFQGGVGAYVKLPLCWGYRYFLELHNIICEERLNQD